MKKKQQVVIFGPWRSINSIEERAQSGLFEGWTYEKEISAELLNRPGVNHYSAYSSNGNRYGDNVLFILNFSNDQILLSDIKHKYHGGYDTNDHNNYANLFLKSGICVYARQLGCQVEITKPEVNISDLTDISSAEIFIRAMAAHVPVRSDISDDTIELFKSFIISSVKSRSIVSIDDIQGMLYQDYRWNANAVDKISSIYKFGLSIALNLIRVKL